MEQITIAGKIFNVPVRYEEGHELTAGEASALNQTYHENLRNNFTRRVKEGSETGVPDGDLQAELDKYAENYEFGVRTGGGGTRDPVMSEAMNIAREKVREHIRSKGKKLVQYSSKTITEGARQVLASAKHGPGIMALAKQRVAEAQAAATIDLEGLVGDLPTKEKAA